MKDPITGQFDIDDDFAEMQAGATYTATATEVPVREDDGEVPNEDVLADKLAEANDELLVATKALQGIYEQRRKVEVACMKSEAAKTLAKAAKDAWEAERVILEQMIAEAERGSAAPLFDKKETKPAVDDGWKKVELASLDLTEATVKKLIGASLRTIGDLQAFIEEKSDAGYSDPLTKIPKIGAGTADKILAALAAFWEKNKQYVVPDVTVLPAPTVQAGQTADVVVPVMTDTPPQPHMNGVTK